MTTRKIKCKICKELKTVYARGLCKKCYGHANYKGTLSKYRVFKKRKSKCGGCGKKKKIVGQGLCISCYNNSRLLKKSLKSGKKIILNTAKINKKEAKKYIENREKEILEDVIRHPREWLDKCNGK